MNKIMNYELLREMHDSKIWNENLKTTQID